MSLSKILKAPAKLFKKENISFLIIRRFDLGLPNDNLRYLSIKPSASISVLRQKIWHLLDLPDFCEETIVLKAGDVEIPLTALRKGNNPHTPFSLEVWPAANAHTFKHIMLTMGSEGHTSGTASIADCDLKSQAEVHQDNKDIETAEMPTKVITKIPQNNHLNSLPPEYKRSDLSCKMSTSSMFFKLPGRKPPRDNFTNILLQIQGDLLTLSTKLTNLEDKIKA